LSNADKGAVGLIPALDTEYDLMNDLGFNLCVMPWSLVVRSVAYFGIRVSQQSRGPRDIG